MKIKYSTILLTVCAYELGSITEFLENNTYEDDMIVIYLIFFVLTFYILYLSGEKEELS